MYPCIYLCLYDHAHLADCHVVQCVLEPCQCTATVPVDPKFGGRGGGGTGRDTICDYKVFLHDTVDNKVSPCSTYVFDLRYLCMHSIRNL